MNQEDLFKQAADCEKAYDRQLSEIKNPLGAERVIEATTQRKEIMVFIQRSLIMEVTEDELKSLNELFDRAITYK